MNKNVLVHGSGGWEVKDRGAISGKDLCCIIIWQRAKKARDRPREGKSTSMIMNL
jgi:hypothetical protein